MAAIEMTLMTTTAGKVTVKRHFDEEIDAAGSAEGAVHRALASAAQVLVSAQAAADAPKGA